MATSTEIVLMHSAFYAQAVADAVGHHFEFGNPSISAVKEEMRSSRPLNITDDTQMAMFGQEAINLSGSVRQLRSEIQAAYLRWYDTQIGSVCANKGLAARKEMQVQRAPGSRCMSSLAELKRGCSPDASQGKGCGPVMRLLPFAGLYLTYSVASVQSVADFSCRVTHTHPDAINATARYMQVAHFLLQGGERKNLGISGGAITEHGQGWVADECVAMALWVLQNAGDYDHLLTLSICHSGDSDSVAAVAGSLWGLAGLKGYEKYLPRLVEKSAIDSLFV